MFDIFKRKKKQAESSQAEAEITETEASVEAEEIVEAVGDPAIERAQAPETTVPQEMLKAGEPASEETVFLQEEADASIEQPAEKKKGFFSRLATGLSKTRSGFSDGVANLLLGKKEIDDDLLEDLEIDTSTKTEEGGSVIPTNPFEIVEMIRRQNSMNDATNPSDAIDDALKSFNSAEEK